jgi:hypothetical protein
MIHVFHYCKAKKKHICKQGTKENLVFFKDINLNSNSYGSLIWVRNNQVLITGLDCVLNNQIQTKSDQKLPKYTF